MLFLNYEPQLILFFRTLNTKIRFLITIVLSIIILLIWYFLFYVPLINKINEINNLISQTKIDLEKSNKALCDLSKYDNKLTSLKNKSLYKLPKEKVLNLITQILNKNKINCKKFSPSKVIENNKNKDLLLLNLESNYHKIDSFLDKLKAFAKIRTLILAKSDPNKIALNIELKLKDHKNALQE